jgi:hypothetical protein
MGKMNKSNYQMITLHEYVKMLDNESKADDSTQKLKENVEKYFLRARRAQTNAKILEALLA